MGKIKDKHGNEMDWNEAFAFMDKDLCNIISFDGSMEEQEFFNRYCDMHREKFGEDFEFKK